MCPARRVPRPAPALRLQATGIRKHRRVLPGVADVRCGARTDYGQAPSLYIPVPMPAQPGGGPFHLSLPRSRLVWGSVSQERSRGRRHIEIPCVPARLKARLHRAKPGGISYFGNLVWPGAPGFGRLPFTISPTTARPRLGDIVRSQNLRCSAGSAPSALLRRPISAATQHAPRDAPP